MTPERPVRRPVHRSLRGALALLAATGGWLGACTASAPRGATAVAGGAPASTATAPLPATPATRKEQELSLIAEAARPATICLIYGLDGESRRGTGTGVIVGAHDGKAWVITAGHVAREPGRPCHAVLPDGRVFRGRSEAAVARGTVDLGVVSLDVGSEAVPVVPLGSTASLRSGDWVVVLGHPLGLWTMDDERAAGSDDALPRWRNDPRMLPSLVRGNLGPDAIRPAVVRTGRVWELPEGGIRMDAPIEAGDSGGPVLNTRGEVVGIASRCGVSSFWNWATSVDLLACDAEHGLLVLDPDLVAETADPDDQPSAGAGTWRLPPLAKDRSALMEWFDAGASAVGASVVEVLVDGRVACLGIVVGPDGEVVTKASEVGPTGSVEVRQGLFGVRASRAAWDPDADLLLLRAPALRAPALSLDWTAPPEPGHFAVSVGADGKPFALGAVSLESASEDDLDARPFMGVAWRPRERGGSGDDASGVDVTGVTPSTPAARAGLRQGDVILSADGQRLRGQRPLVDAMAGRQAGDVVVLEVLRDGERLSVPLALDRRQPSIQVRDRGNTRSLTSAVLPRRTEVFRHDGVVPPELCGSPVVDSRGRLVGFNAGRYDRTATLAIPVAELDRRVRAMRRDASEEDPGRFDRLADASFAVTEDPRGRLRLPAADSRLTMGRRGRDDARNAWTPTGAGLLMYSEDVLRWPLQLSAPGRFEVFFEGACRGLQTVRLRIGDRTFEAEVPGGTHRRRSAFSLGEIDLRDTGRLEVLLDWRTPPFGRMGASVEAIELRRVRERPEGTEPAPPDATEAEGPGGRMEPERPETFP